MLLPTSALSFRASAFLTITRKFIRTLLWSAHASMPEAHPVSSAQNSILTRSNTMNTKKIVCSTLGLLIAFTTLFTPAHAKDAPVAKQQSGRCDNLSPVLLKYISEVVTELDQLTAERKDVLSSIANDVITQLEAGKPAKLTFICTHHSRRSHMSQTWAQTAAYYHGLDRVETFSGGTQATACNCRTVTAMQRVGFEFRAITAGENPTYLVRYAA